MRRSDRPSGRWPRSAPVVVFLLLALAIAGVLAYQAQVAARSNRATAEHVLQDYAAFAARQFAQRAGNQLNYYGFYPATRALANAVRSGAGSRLPAPDQIRLGADQYTRQSLDLVRYFFRYDLVHRSLAIGSEAPAGAARWLEETFGAPALPLYDPNQGFSTVRGSIAGTERLFVFQVELDEAKARTAVLGFESDPERFVPILQQVLDGPPLLPPSLTGGVVYDSVVSLRVTDGPKLLFQTEAQYPPTFAAHDTLGARFGRLAVDVALRPDLAEKLIIGGLPRSRLPLLLGLLALTAGLIGAALIQLRRESQLAELRTEFVASVSHELRTPLAQIRMFTETMLLDRIRSEDERRRSLQIVDQEARRLTQLVENLLHFSRSERRLHRLAREPTELTDLVRRVAGDFAPLAESRRVKLVLELPDEVSASVDPSAIRQILLNLLDNAVKYGPQGQSVTIGVQSEEARIRIWVDDEGPGVPASDRERVWERFWRAERERQSGVAGTGIGLAVVRELVALHGGGAWVDSAPGGGARIVIEIPRKED